MDVIIPILIFVGAFVIIVAKHAPRGNQPRQRARRPEWFNGLTCPRTGCGYSNRPDARFCAQCGQRLQP